MQAHAKKTRAEAPPTLPPQRMLVTPEMAATWLAHNTANRPLRKSVVERYARDMTGGRWQFCGDVIRFGENGELIDGQHRLNACVAAGVPLEAIVVHGLSPSARDVLDIGEKRRAADALHFHGFETHTVAVAAAANWLRSLKSLSGRWERPSHTEIIALCDKHRGLIDSARRYYSNRDRRGLGPPPTLLIAMHYIGTYLLDQEEAAEAFLTVFETGVPAYEGDPAQMWREKLLQGRGKGFKTERYLHVRGITYAWNTFARSEPLKIFRVPKDATIDGLDPEQI